MTQSDLDSWFALIDPETTGAIDFETYIEVMTGVNQFNFVAPNGTVDVETFYQQEFAEDYSLDLMYATNPTSADIDFTMWFQSVAYEMNFYDAEDVDMSDAEWAAADADYSGELEFFEAQTYLESLAMYQYYADGADAIENSLLSNEFTADEITATDADQDGYITKEEWFSADAAMNEFYMISGGNDTISYNNATSFGINDRIWEFLDMDFDGNATWDDWVRLGIASNDFYNKSQGEEFASVDSFVATLSSTFWSTWFDYDSDGMIAFDEYISAQADEAKWNAINSGAAFDQDAAIAFGYTLDEFNYWLDALGNGSVDLDGWLQAMIQKNEWEAQFAALADPWTQTISWNDWTNAMDSEDQFYFMDADFNGEITWAEYFFASVQFLPYNQALVDGTFPVSNLEAAPLNIDLQSPSVFYYDLDNDGFVSVEEYANVISNNVFFEGLMDDTEVIDIEVAFMATDRNWQQMILADTNVDGVIDVSEYQNIVGLFNQWEYEFNQISNDSYDFTFEQIAAQDADITPEIFNATDSNGDGYVDLDEYSVV